MEEVNPDIDYIICETGYTSRINFQKLEEIFDRNNQLPLRPLLTYDTIWGDGLRTNTAFDDTVHTNLWKQIKENFDYEGVIVFDINEYETNHGLNIITLLHNALKEYEYCNMFDICTIKLYKNKDYGNILYMSIDCESG